MSARGIRIVVIWALVLLTFWVGERFYRNYLWKAEAPHIVSTAGKLSEWEKSNIELFLAASPSVVSITTEQLRMNPMIGTEVAQGAGSGFIWDETGHVVTNFHVIEGASTVYVQLHAGDPIRARVVGGARQVRYRGREALECPCRAPPSPGRHIENLAGRAGDLRDRKSFWTAAHADDRDRKCARAAAPDRPGTRSARGYPDRRSGQSGQLRRPATRQQRTVDRRQHRYPVGVRCIGRHRFRDPGGPHQARGA